MPNLCMCRPLKLSMDIHNNTYRCVSLIDVNLMSAIAQRCDVLDTPSQLIIVLKGKHEDLAPNLYLCRELRLSPIIHNNTQRCVSWIVVI